MKLKNIIAVGVAALLMGCVATTQKKVVPLEYYDNNNISLQRGVLEDVVESVEKIENRE